MKINLVYFYIFAILVLVDGIYSYLARRPASSIELLFGTVFLLTLPFFKKDKKGIYLVALISSLSLLIIYGFSFATTTHFFPALLSMISFFLSLLLIFKIFG